MRKSVCMTVIFGSLSLMAASAPLGVGLAHEGHKMECTETSIDAMNVDIQAMKDGEEKTTAMNEMKMADEMMAKKDMKGCLEHMDNAMDATEK
jgi:hypothetical protein